MTYKNITESQRPYLRLQLVMSKITNMTHMMTMKMFCIIFETSMCVFGLVKAGCLFSAVKYNILWWKSVNIISVSVYRILKKLTRMLFHGRMTFNCRHRHVLSKCPSNACCLLSPLLVTFNKNVSSYRKNELIGMYMICIKVDLHKLSYLLRS